MNRRNFFTVWGIIVKVVEKDKEEYDKILDIAKEKLNENN